MVYIDTWNVSKWTVKETMRGCKNIALVCMECEQMDCGGSNSYLPLHLYILILKHFYRKCKGRYCVILRLCNCVRSTKNSVTLAVSTSQQPLLRWLNLDVQLIPTFHIVLEFILRQKVPRTLMTITYGASAAPGDTLAILHFNNFCVVFFVLV